MRRSATKTQLDSIEVLTNQAMRIATGAFKSTTIETLRSTTDEMSFQMQRKYFISKLLHENKITS